MADSGADPVAAGRRKVGAHLGGGGKRRVGAVNHGYIHPEEAEYSRAVHFYATAYGPLQGEGEESGGAGGYVVVGSGGHQFGGC